MKQPEYTEEFMRLYLRKRAEIAVIVLKLNYNNIAEKIDEAVERVYADLWHTEETKFAAEVYLDRYMVVRALYEVLAKEEQKKGCAI